MSSVRIFFFRMIGALCSPEFMGAALGRML